MNETLSAYALLLRLFGNLLKRAPNDENIQPVFAWLQQNGLRQQWLWEEDKDTQTALDAVAMPIAPAVLAADFEKILTAQPQLSTLFPAQAGEALQVFADVQSLPNVEMSAPFSQLLLSGAWLMDQKVALPLQRQFFADYVFPASATVLPRIEQAAQLPFYRQMAWLTRELLVALADELDAENA